MHLLWGELEGYREQYGILIVTVDDTEGADLSKRTSYNIIFKADF